MLGEWAFELCCYRIVMLLLVFENCKLSGQGVAAGLLLSLSALPKQSSPPSNGACSK